MGLTRNKRNGTMSHTVRQTRVRMPDVQIYAIYVKITKKANRLHSMHVCLLSIAPANVPLSIDRRTRPSCRFPFTSAKSNKRSTFKAHIDIEHTHRSKTLFYRENQLVFVLPLSCHSRKFLVWHVFGTMFPRSCCSAFLLGLGLNSLHSSPGARWKTDSNRGLSLGLFSCSRAHWEDFFPL